MSIGYNLTLAGRTPIRDVAGRALPDGSAQLVDRKGRPASAPPIWSANLFASHGFMVDVLAGTNGYFDVEGDDGMWKWEPAAHVRVHFDMDAFTDPAWRVPNMLIIVARVLDTGPEDAAFDFNANELLLRRVDGRLTKHRRATWWEYYPGADHLVPG
jgi:hypothetical protein